MTANLHRVRIDFVGISQMLVRNEPLEPFYALVQAIKTRLSEAGTGTDAFAGISYGGTIEMSCANADTCYASIEDLLVTSPLTEGATAVLIYGDEDDAEHNEFQVGTRKE